MAVIIELDKEILKRALDAQIMSLKRGLVKQFNPAMKELIEKDIAIIQNGINTIKAAPNR